MEWISSINDTTYTESPYVDVGNGLLLTVDTSRNLPLIPIQGDRCVIHAGENDTVTVEFILNDTGYNKICLSSLDIPGEYYEEYDISDVLDAETGHLMVEVDSSVEAKYMAWLEERGEEDSYIRGTYNCEFIVSPAREMDDNGSITEIHSLYLRPVNMPYCTVDSDSPERRVFVPYVVDSSVEMYCDEYGVFVYVGRKTAQSE